MGQDASSLRNLERKTGYYFQKKALLEEAMSHDSRRVNDKTLRDYQRLEHLGDAVISFVITNYLFCKHPEWDEGPLSSERSSLVGRTRQLQIAETLELQKFVQMNPGVEVFKFKRYDKFLEALIGAIYMDAGGEGTGYAAVREVIYRLWGLQEPPKSCVVM